MSPGNARAVRTPAASPGEGRANELRAMSRPARARHHETGGRAGNGAAQRNVRPVPPGAGAPVRLRARGAPRRLHGLPYTPRFVQLEDAPRTRRQPVPEV